jgi:hypothetical protein
MSRMKLCVSYNLKTSIVTHSVVNNIDGSFPFNRVVTVCACVLWVGLKTRSKCYQLQMCHWLSEHEYGTGVMLLRHILTSLCEVFSVTPTMTAGYVEEDLLHGFHESQICIL